MDKTGNIFERNMKPFEVPKSRTVEKSSITPGTIEQRHLEANLYATKFGLAADRPITPGVDSHYFVYFATDTNVVSYWNGSTWVSETLT